MSDTVVFVDNIGRTVMGVENKKASTKTQLAVDDPSIVFVQPNPESGQIQVQVIPLFFKELVGEESRDGALTWYFNRSNLVTNPTLSIDEKLVSQYERVTSAGPEAPPGIQVEKAPEKEPEVVKLFDDDEEK